MLLIGGLIVTFWVPRRWVRWLMSSYNGNYAAIVAEIASGRLANRRAAPC